MASETNNNDPGNNIIQWKTNSFFLNLCKNPDDEEEEESSYERVNLVEIIKWNGPGRVAHKSKERWWFQPNLTYKDIKGIVKSVAKEECGFKVSPIKRTRVHTNVKFKCHEHIKKECRFGFCVHECPDRNRWFVQSPGSCCWTHTNHHPFIIEPPTTTANTTTTHIVVEDNNEDDEGTESPFVDLDYDDDDDDDIENEINQSYNLIHPKIRWTFVMIIICLISILLPMYYSNNMWMGGTFMCLMKKRFFF